MPAFIADLHIHSKYSIATSKDMGIAEVGKWAKLKGIGLVGTGDFTHPKYFQEIKDALEADGEGLFKLKNSESSLRFMLSTELCSIFSQGGRTRKLHTLIYAPTFEAAEKIIKALSVRGKVETDGRPIFTFPACDLARLIWDISEECMIIPAHAWTPWFSVFGSLSGFDSLEECYGDLTPKIRAIETGLSSDPEMNWRISALDDITLISNSDAHSPNKLGREANVFDCALDYFEIKRAIDNKNSGKLVKTIEFFPEEGKYHFDGHRNCGVLFSPSETRAHGGICPKCHRPLTIGVMYRVEELADRDPGFRPPNAAQAVHLIPLQEIIAEALGQGMNTTGVQTEYHRLVEHGRSEFRILLDLSRDELAQFVPPRILSALMHVREGKLQITPGHDGQFGKISIFGDEEEPSEQMSLF